MIKNFFEAMFFGIRNGTEAFLEIALSLVLYVCAFVPAVLASYFSSKIFGMELAVCIMVIGTLAGIYLMEQLKHCYKAARYKKEHNCDIREAWYETGYTGPIC